MWTVLAHIVLGNPRHPPPHTHTHQLRLSVYCFLILRWNSRKTIALTKQSDVRTTPSLSHRKKNSGSAVVLLYWYTISIIFIWTNQTLVNQLNSSVLSRILFTFGPTKFRANAPWPPPLIFPSWAPLPPGKGISGIATTTDPVGKPKNY